MSVSVANHGMGFRRGRTGRNVLDALQRDIRQHSFHAERKVCNI